MFSCVNNTEYLHDMATKQKHGEKGRWGICKDCIYFKQLLEVSLLKIFSSTVTNLPLHKLFK